ncbi:MAG: double-strand break repair helicase AddA [Pseudomonadota bacterium]
MTDLASKRQIFAAEPDQSTWLSANAGSGKTRVLTNRVARLLYRGVDPRNILCLTYTKAAASEMQNRLFATLGKWAMLDEDALRAALIDLGEGHIKDLNRARTLFARAIDTPGGLKIQTIHALCASILRQFPLEAGVSPHFVEMDTPQQEALLEEVLTHLASEHPSALQAVAAFYSDDLGKLALNVAGKADEFENKRDQSEIFRAFDLVPGTTQEEIARSVVNAEDIAFLRSLIPMLRQGSKTDNTLADNLATLDTEPESAFALLQSLFLTKERKIRQQQPTKNVRDHAAFAPLLGEFEAIRLRTEQGVQRTMALKAAQQTEAIQHFAQTFLPAYQDAKQRTGLLDFDDLIRHTRRLLKSQSQQWVMYRLDGKIDHILVDEAQDTSPMQWDVIEALAEEMASGEGDRPRTLFVVGDKKQSIYSFQGADAAGFDSRAERFRERLAGGQGLRPANLEYSFRSSPAILEVVDQVFNEGQIAGLGADHKAYHDTLPGRVDLWPLVPPSEKGDETPWSETGDRTVENAASFQLAQAVAEFIDQTVGNVTIPGKNGPKLVEAGDIMVLVQRRSAIFDKIIHACKTKGLAIAGADRLKLGSELAVRDLLALLSFLALPDDSLSLAAALRSPLLGLSERDLYQLAAQRERGTLWAALRKKQADFPNAHEMLTSLRAKVDFQRPYDLLETILTQHEGRRRLLARLGPEAEDGINELLNQALAHERNIIPSLTSFVNAAQSADVEVKRQSDTSGNMIRVMTVHGAKGLESPIVILPDTTGQQKQATGLLNADGLPVHQMRKEDAPLKILSARNAKKDADAEERSRLLYVAMTRAEKWLIVCGVEPSKKEANWNWHQTVENGLKRAGAKAAKFDLGEGLRYAHGEWPDTPEKSLLETNFEPAALTFGPVAPMPESPKHIAPSELPGAKALGGEGRSEEEAKRRGRQIHLLLEHLPIADDPYALATGLLSDGPDAAAANEIEALLQEAQRNLTAYPDIFGEDALAEVGITADLPTLNAKMTGIIDRLVFREDSILAVDFKTNATVPATPEETPDGILRQMGAYLEGLQAIYPDTPIELAILWTSSATLMPLEHGIVRRALQETPTS